MLVYDLTSPKILMIEVSYDTGCGSVAVSRQRKDARRYFQHAFFILDVYILSMFLVIECLDVIESSVSTSSWNLLALQLGQTSVAQSAVILVFKLCKKIINVDFFGPSGTSCICSICCHQVICIR